MCVYVCVIKYINIENTGIPFFFSMRYSKPMSGEVVITIVSHNEEAGSSNLSGGVPATQM